VDEEERRKLQLSHHNSTEGQKEVLVVRVSNDNVAARSVQQSALQLIDDIFNDENNAKEVYRACSNDRLELIPSPSLTIQTECFRSMHHGTYATTEIGS